MFFIVEVKDDMCATHQIISIAPTLAIAEKIAIDDFFDGDEDYMRECEVGEREYLDNCKGCIIATEDKLYDLVADESLDIEDVAQFCDWLSDIERLNDYLENGF